MGLLDLVNIQNQSDSDADPVVHNPKYISKEEFYRKRQFHYLRTNTCATVQTDQITTQNHAAQIENGREKNTPRRTRAKSSHSLAYDNLTNVDHDDESSVNFHFITYITNENLHPSSH
jgi:hypothetical protein